MNQQTLEEIFLSKLKDALYQNERFDASFDVQLTSVLHLLKNLPADQKQMQYLFNEFFPSIILSLLNKKAPTDCPYLIKIETILIQLMHHFFENIEFSTPKCFDAILKIFDPSKNLYQSIESGYLDSFGLKSNPTTGLLVGQDVAYILNGTKRMWAIGKIISIGDISVTIETYNHQESQIQVLNNNSCIRSLDSTSSEWIECLISDTNFRKSVKKGDKVDYQDSHDNWQEMVVQADQEIFHKDDNSLRQIQVQMIMNYTEGTKSWSYNYQDWINTSNPSLQPHRSMVDFYSDLQNFDDSQDQLIFYPEYPNKFCIQRKEMGSPLFIRVLNGFGSIGGFRQIISIMDIEQQSLDFMTQIIPVLANIYTLFFHPFAKVFVKEIQNIAYRQILNASDNNLRSITKEALEQLILALIKLQRRNCSINKQEKLEKFFIISAISFISSSFLDKQVFGLKQLIEIISGLKCNTFKYLTKNIYQEQLLKNQVFEKVFGADSHTQLIEKSTDFLRYYFREDLMDQEKIIIFLKRAQTSVIQQKLGIFINLAIYKMINDISYDIKQPEIHFIIRKIMNLKKLSIDDINLIYELIRFQNNSEPIVREIMEFFFQIYSQKQLQVISTQDKALKKIIIQKLQEFCRNLHFKVHKQYMLQKCVLNIKSHEFVLTALKFFKKIVETYQSSRIYDWDQEKYTQTDIITEFESEDNLLNLLITDIIFFKQDVKNQMDSLKQSLDETAIYISGENYLSNIKQRLKLISYCINVLPNLPQKTENDLSVYYFAYLNYRIIYGTYQLSIFKILEKKTFFSTFIKPLHLNLVSQILLQIFSNQTSQILRNFSKVIYLNIDLQDSDIECLITLFLLCNESVQNISLNKKVNIGSPTVSIQQKCSILSSANLLVGLPALYSLYLESKCPQKSPLLPLLIHVHMSEGNSLFCQELLKTLKIHPLPTIHLLQELIQQSEETEFSSVKNHFQSRPSRLCKVEYTYQVASYTINVQGSLSILELKQKIGSVIGIGWPFLLFFTDERPVTCYYVAELVGKLAVRKKDVCLERVPLLNAQGQLIEKVKKIFLKWFNSYSENGFMSQQGCAAFIQSCTKEVCSANDQRIQNLFQKFDKDQDGFLTESDFLDFYTQSTIQRLHVVWSNLNSKNVTNDLQEENNNEMVPNDSKNLPRIILSKNIEFYKIIFEIVNEVPFQFQENANLVQKLLNRIPTSFWVIEELNCLSVINSLKDWNILLNLKNKWYLLYQLQVLESFFYEKQDLVWIQLFLTKGGFIVLFDLFNAIQNLNANTINRVLYLFSNQLVQFQTAQNYQSHLCLNLNQKQMFFQQVSQIFSANNNYLQLVQLQIKQEYALLCENVLPLILIQYIFFKQAEQQSQQIQSKSNLFQECQSLMHQESLSTSVIAEAIQPYLENLFYLFKPLQLFLQLHNLFLTLIQNEFINHESKNIINYCLAIMNTLLCKYPNCQSFFINNFIKSYIGLLFDKKSYVRKLIKTSLYIICRLTAKSDFCFQILDQLINLLEIQNDKLEWCFYYELIGQLLGEIEQLQSEKNKQQVNSNKLFDVIISKMISHISKENFITSSQDKMLAGYINLANHLVQLNPSILSQKQPDFACQIFKTFLFYFDIEQQQLMTFCQGSVKCKSQESRKAAYKLLVHILQQSNANLELFINSEQGFKSIYTQLSNFITETTNIANRGGQDFRGLFNMRNICYINSVIQQLYMNSQLRNVILALETPDPKIVPCSSNFYVGLIHDNFLFQLQKTFSFLYSSQRDFYDPYQLCFSIKEFNNQPIDVNIQEDANEFSNKMFDLIEQETKVFRFYFIILQGTIYERVLQSIYQGSLHIVKICQNCGYKRNQEELFYNLILEVKNLNNISASLKKFVEGEVLDNVHCEECDQKSGLEKHQYFDNLPNNLLIQLQRFSYDFDNAMALTKINTKVEFPQILDMAPFLYEKTENDTIYNLKGVILHTGYAQAGHYRSLVKEKGIWYLFDDRSVTQLINKSTYDMGNFEKDCYGGDFTSDWHNMNNQNVTNAYILIYEKQQKNPIQLVFKDQEHLLTIQKQLNLNIIQINLQKDKIIGQIEYYGLQISIPSIFQNQIWKDNFKSMIESHIFCQDFFIFLKELNFLFYLDYDKTANKCSILNIVHYVNPLHQSISQEKVETYENLCESLFKLLNIFSWHSRQFQVKLQKQPIQIILEQLKYFLTLIPNKVEYFFKNYIRSYYQICEGMSNDVDIVRKIYFQLSQQIISILAEYYKFNYYDNYKISIQIDVEMYIIDLLKNIAHDGTKNVLKMSEYFQFFNDLIQCRNDYFVTLFMNQDMISIFIDYYLQKDSPLFQKNQKSIDNSNKFINSDPLILSVCNLCEKIDINQISSNDKLCLNSIQFYKTILKNNLCISNTGKLMQIICQDDLQISKQFCELLLQQLNALNGDELHPYLNYIFDFLMIKDQFSIHRWQCILGFPQLVLRNGHPMLNEKEDQSYDYITLIPIFNYNNEKCLTILSMLYQNRKKHSTKNILLINKLMQVTDYNELLKQFFQQLEPPNYIDKSIFDFFNTIIQNYKENQRSMIYNMEGFTRLDHEALLQDTSSLLDNSKNDKFKNNSQDFNDLLEFKQSDFHIYGKFKNQNLIKKFDVNHNVIVEVWEKDVWIMPSQPDNFKNLSFENLQFQDKFICPKMIKINEIMDFSFNSEQNDEQPQNTLVTNCLRMVYIQNSSNQTYMIQLMIDQINGKIPKILQVISNQNTRDLILIIQKMDISQEWGQIFINSQFYETQDTIEVQDHLALTPSTGDFFASKKSCQHCFEENDVANSFCINCFQDFTDFQS